MRLLARFRNAGATLYEVQSLLGHQGADDAALLHLADSGLRRASQGFGSVASNAVRKGGEGGQAE